MHDLELPAPILQITLVNADDIDPEQLARLPTRELAAEEAEGVQEVPSDLKRDVVRGDGIVCALGAHMYDSASNLGLLPKVTLLSVQTTGSLLWAAGCISTGRMLSLSSSLPG